MDGLTVFDTENGDMPLDAKRLAAVAASGDSFFVNETTGGDTNTGSASSPFASLGAAFAAAQANHGDVIYLQGTVHLTSTLNWNKDGVSLVGSRPSNNSRCRISQSGSSVFSPLVNVTGQGCVFQDIATFHGFNNASAQVCWQDSGGRNYYRRCQLLGGGHATAAAQAGMRSLLISGNGENLFEECTIGLDTIVRATNNNASLEFTGGSPRNVFRRCLFQSLISNVSDVHVLVGAGGIDRYVLFDDCIFANAVESTGAAMTAAILANAAAGGAVILRRPLSLGAAAIALTGPVYIDGSAQGAATTGIAIKAT